MTIRLMKPHATGNWIKSVLIAATSVAAISCGAAERDANQKPDERSNTQASKMSSAMSDRITLPESRRVFSARSHAYVFVVSTRDGWKSPHAIGELYFHHGDNQTLLWSRELPQQFGPRFALIADNGTVVMNDEWINVNSPYAVLIYDKSGQSIAQHSTDEVQAALRVPMKEIVAAAKHGWWIGAPPTLNSAQDAVQVPSAGKVLVVQLADGKLSTS